LIPVAALRLLRGWLLGPEQDAENVPQALQDRYVPVAVALRTSVQDEARIGGLAKW